ncbi:ADP-ribosyltransferase [Paenibacillus larvae]
MISFGRGLIHESKGNFGDQSRSPEWHGKIKYGKEFKDSEKAEAWGRKYYAKWYRNLTITEEKSLTNYTTEKGYLINKYLRKNDGEIGKNELLDRDINNIDRALKKVKTTETIKVYRRLGENAFGMEPDSLRDKNKIKIEKAREFAEKFINTIRKDQGYLSTTLVSGLSQDTKSKSPEIVLMPIILELNVPKGTHAAYINDLSHKPWEQELLINRGSSYKIHGISIIVESGRERLKIRADLIK